MFEFFKKIAEWLFNDEVKTSSKVWLAIISIFVLFIINDLTSVTKTIRINNKIDSIESLIKLKENTKDSTVINFSNDEIKHITSNDGIIKPILDYFLQSLTKQQKATTKQVINNKSDIASDSTSNINYKFWFLFSSGGIFYFLSFIMFFIMIFQNKSESISQRFGQAILALFVISAFGGMLSLVCSFMPDFLEDYNIDNYSINFIIQFSVIFLMYKMSNNK